MERNRLAVLAFTAVTAGITLAAAPPALATAAAASPSASASAPAGHWGNARQVPGLGMLNTGNDAAVTNVSCSSPGNCTAGGRYFDGRSLQSFVIEEKDGIWGSAVRLFLPDPAATDSTLVSLSCGGAGSCVAVGVYDKGSVMAGFYTVEDNGVWVLSGSTSGGTTFSQVNAVSCTREDNCAAGGFEFDHSTNPSGPDQPFLLDEKSGKWGLPQPVPGLQALHEVQGTVNSISCASPGNCAALGSYEDNAKKSQAFVADEHDGGWGQAQQIPGTPTLGDIVFGAGTVSCASAGNCAATGEYEASPGDEQMFVSDEVNGVWQSAQQVPVPAGKDGQVLLSINEMSCAAPGSCVAVGSYSSDGAGHAFVAEEKHGTWKPIPGPGGAGPGSEATSVSCTSAGNCVVVGDALSGKATQAFTLTEVNGRWGKVRALPGIAVLNKGGSTRTWQVSCASTGNCALGGQFDDTHGHPHAFLADESTATTTALGLSGARIKFGHEQSEKLSVKVEPRTGGTPSGKVTMLAGGTKICAIKLAAGKGSCALSARQLKPGSYQLTAAYGGSQAYAGSASAKKTLTVTK
jgi:hypothetical protein